mmetsp:Transcript_101397/g.196093  ORF Transcript_101397/g.196093 Transcript_101397/m.196093 type:complete len:81 (-) Transcript_101397:169-411(-)
MLPKLGQHVAHVVLPSSKMLSLTAPFAPLICNTTMLVPFPAVVDVNPDACNDRCGEHLILTVVPITIPTAKVACNGGKES